MASPVQIACLAPSRLDPNAVLKLLESVIGARLSSSRLCDDSHKRFPRWCDVHVAGDCSNGML